MSRWRPAPINSTAIITPEGFKRLKAELEHLWRERRPEIVRALTAAAAEGDRSENAEYIYRKKQLGEIDRRVRYLSKRIPALRVATSTPTDVNSIFFGACIQLEDESGVVFHYRIVGPDETSQGYISIDSPLARAALKKQAGDALTVELPSGVVTFNILSVSYTGTNNEPEQIQHSGGG